MGKILAQLERMGSSEYYKDTPSTVTVNPMMDAGYEATGGVAPYQDPMAGMSAEEVRMYGEADGITTDLGEAHDITITGGSEAGVKKDIDSFLNNLATSGIGKGPEPVEPVRGSPPPRLSIPQSIKGFRPTESPYGIPTELGTQAEIQQEVARRIAKQLENTIVKRPYLNFQGLI